MRQRRVFLEITSRFEAHSNTKIFQNITKFQRFFHRMNLISPAIFSTTSRKIPKYSELGQAANFRLET